MQSDGETEEKRAEGEAYKPSPDPDAEQKPAETQSHPPSQPSAETCADCGRSLVPLKTHIYVKRPCETCGRDTYLQDRDPKTSGIRINKGDQVTLAGDFLNRMWRLVGGGRFTEQGLNMFARQLFLPDQDLIRQPSAHLPGLLDAWEKDADAFVEESKVFAGIDPNNEADGPAFAEILKAEHDKNSAVPWALMVGSVAVPGTREAIARGDAEAAAGAAIIAASARALLMYKVHLQEAVRRGHAVEQLRSSLVEWQANRKNDGEEFWQTMLSRNPFMLSQALSAPAVVVAGKAYVGGKAVDNKGGNLADFLLKNELTRFTTLTELKTPVTALLGPEYRNHVYPPSPELAGAVSQVLGYSVQLSENPLLGRDAADPFDTARPECVVLIGDSDQLTDLDRRRSFNMYRSELRNVRVMTFDELFKRVETLLKLFGG